MRLLLLHTDEAICTFMPEMVSAGLAEAFRPEAPEIQTEDGRKLTYKRAVALLKEDLDGVIVNLRLPEMLSIRIAELVHLAAIPARLILMSGTPKDLGPAASLYDDYIRTPCFEKSLPSVLAECLARPFAAQRRALTSQEHLDVAILNLLHRCDSLAPGCRGALHAFAMYRDAYLHQPPTSWPKGITREKTTTAQRLDFFAPVRPLDFAKRVDKIMQRIEGSPLYRTDQKALLNAQFNYLLDVGGLVLLNFRQELEKLLGGLEQFSRMAQSGAGGAEISPAKLRELLLSHSSLIPYVRQGITRIAALLPASG